MDRDDDFVGQMMYLPNRLLADNARHMPSGIAESTLRLGVAVAARLEDWAKERSLQSGRTPDRSAELSLNPTDRRRYEQTVRRFVGAWENVTLMTGSYYGWSKEVSAHVAWSRLVASWPLIWEHLRSTATLVMLAVLHSDRFAAQTYADTLLKWLEMPTLHLLGPDLVSDFRMPRLFEPSWDEINATVTRFLPGGVGEANPAAVFLGVLRNTHRDTTLLTGILLLRLGLAGEGSATLARDLTRQLLQQQRGWDSGGSFPPAGGARFQNIFRTLVRVLVAPEFPDELVESLDHLGEPDRIPGRVYTRTVRQARDLRLHLLAFLIVVYETGAHDLTDRAVAEYLDFLGCSCNEEDLRDLQRQFSGFVHDTVDCEAEIKDAHNQLANEEQFEDKSTSVRQLFEKLVSEMQRRCYGSGS